MTEKCPKSFTEALAHEHENMSDSDKAYFVGYRDGFRRCKAEMQDEFDDRIEQLDRQRDEMKAEKQTLKTEIRALRAEIACMRALDGATETERDQAARLN